MTATNKQEEEYHVPVMLKECLEGLEINPDGIYVDVTFGGGGHSREIFKQLSSKGRLIVFDQDPDARKNAWEADNFNFVASNFAFISNHLKMMGFPKVDGILADLGVSSHQFDDGNRGFSIRSNDPLDMRMNQSGDVTARTICHEYSDRDLTKIFREFGELSNAYKIATTIVMARENKKIKTTGDLMTIIESCAPKYKEHKFFAQVFQALRIEVNDEFGVLEKFLEKLPDALASGGRIAILSFHSGEDRRVKKSFKSLFQEGIYSEVAPDPIRPSAEECNTNPRARSAKLRWAIKA